MEHKEVSRRGFFSKTATLAGAAGAILSVEEQHLMAFQQGPPQGRPQGEPGGRGGPPVVPDVPGPIPTIKIGGIEVTRLIAGHNLVVGQAHEGGSGLIYISGLLKAYFTEDKVLETFAAYEKYGINTSGARMAANMAGYVKKYMARGGKLNWMAGISSERDIPMALDMGCKLGYVHGNTSDALIRSEGGVTAIGKLLDAIRNAKMAGGICSHDLAVPMACEKAGIRPDFYLKTFNTANFMLTNAGVPSGSGPGEGRGGGEGGRSGANAAPLVLSGPVAEQAAKTHIDFMASVKVPWIGFKVLAAGRVAPADAFPYCVKQGCDALLVGMYDFQVQANANLAKQVFLDKDKLGRTRAWYTS
jgi:hypothetical protein